MTTGYEVANTIMADGALERIKAYIDRGRHCQKLSNEDLIDALVAAYREFEAVQYEPFGTEKTRVDDVSSEFELRELAIPYDAVRQQFDGFIASVQKLFNNLTDERKAEINAKMIEDSLASRRSRN